MESELKQAFRAIQADPALREHTKAGVLARMGSPTRPSAHRRYALAAAACCTLLLGAGGYFWLTPTAVISLDINPSLELGVNRFDRVVSAVGYNREGEVLADSLSLLFLPYDQAVVEVVDSAPVQACLAQEELLSIGVVSLQGNEGERILSTLQAHTAAQERTYCRSLSLEEVSSAHQVGLSYGKYQAYLELSALSDQFTPEDIGQLTMREIHNLLEQLGGDSSSPGNGPGGPGNASGESGQAGAGPHGMGHGYGWEQKHGS